MHYYFKPIVLSSTLAMLIGSGHGAIADAAESDRLKDGDMEWTLGLGAGVFNYNYYPGANATNRFIIPAPYFTFRSPWLEIDRGVKGFLYTSESVVLDISADFGLPVNSDDTQARKGMPDLDFMAQLGPSLEFPLNEKNKNYFDVRFEIPLRVAFVTDLKSAENIGYVFEPRFTFNHRRQARTGLTHKATLGVKFANEDYHSYYYDVAAEHATASRPEFKSDAGYGGSFIDYSISYKTGNVVYWALLRYQSLHGAVFEDSPLVLNDDYYFIGFGFAWIIAGSL